MAAKPKAADQPEPTDIEGSDDVEGHSMLIDPSSTQSLAAARSREIERQVKDQQRARDARGQAHKHR